MAQILPHPALLELFARKVEALTATLDDASVRTEAAQVLSTLIESVTIYPAGRGGSVCLHRLAGRISGSPLVDHAAARSDWWKYTWLGVRPPSAEWGLTAL